MTSLGHFLFGLTIWLSVPAGTAQTIERSARVAILDFGSSITAQRSVEAMRPLFAAAPARDIQLIDRDLSRAAARGAGYSGSLNLSLPEARDLGAAIGCDFYILGDAQTLRRSPSSGPIYFESYAALFLVSARTGKLITWERPSFSTATPEASEKLLLAELGTSDRRQRYMTAIRAALADERHEREVGPERNAPVIEDSTDGNDGQAQGLRRPRPYRRLKPPYPDTAARADAEATVDVLVDLDKEGEVSHLEIARWAGFGLDDATLNTVRQLRFFPAMRDGAPIPTRVLLRYNFQRPQQ